MALALSCTGCWFHKSPRVFAPPGIQPQAAAMVRTDPPPVLDFPGLDLKVTLEPPQLPAPIFPDIPPPPAPPAATPARRPPVATAPKPPVPETPAPPKLGQIFTPEQAREYVRTLDESLDRVRRALETAGKKTLTAEQTETVNRIRTFQQQAEQARDQDLVTAVSLARRADLLAKDLVERLP